mgnify:CR=1 FL=1
MSILVTGGAGFSCSTQSRRSLKVMGNPDTNPADIPWFVKAFFKVTPAVDRQAKRTLDILLDKIFEWLEVQRATLEPLLR